MIFKYIFIYVLVCCSFNHAAEKIKFAAIIFRHGDRTPVQPYPTDPWRNESLWPVKFGQLTNIGKKQQYALGKWLRERYSHLLSENFNPTEIHVRSTDVDRTLMSAQVNLAGMYPPKKNDVWDTNLMWQPIPVHTVPEIDDEVLAMKKKCKAYNAELYRFTHSKPYKDRLNKYRDLMQYLSANTGMQVNDYNDISDIYSTLKIEELYNFSLPNWTDLVYPNKLRDPSCYSFLIPTATPKLAKLMVGPIMKQIVKDIVYANYDESGHKRVTMYSAHDFTVANILNAMGLFDGNCPVYTATILIELVHGDSSEYIRVLYRNSTEIVEPYWLEIPYCGKKCSFDKFISLYENLILIDWERDCGNISAPLLGIYILVGLAIFATLYFSHKIHFARVNSDRETKPMGRGANFSLARSSMTSLIKPPDS